MSAAIPLSIVVPAHDAAHYLPRCLDALLAQVMAGDEIVVVDDGSSDGTTRVATRPGVRVVSLPRCVGSAAARNAGVAATTQATLLFVDADVVVHADALARVRAHLSAHPAHAAVIGSYDARPDAPAWLSQYRNLLHHFVHQRQRGAISHFWTGLGAVRRAAFDAVGGFHPREAIMDVEFGYQLRRAGYALALDPELQGTHLKEWTLPLMLHTDIFIRAKPWTRILLSMRHAPDDFSLGWRERASVILAWAAFALLALSIALAPLLAAALAALGAFALVNRELLAFLARERGLAFAIAAVGMHLVYAFSCGVGFALGLASHLAGPDRPQDRDAATARGSW